MIKLQDLIDRFGESELAQLTDRDNYQTINEMIANKAIDDASAEVESYLKITGLIARNHQGKLIYRHTNQIPYPLVIKTCDIARYYLYENGVTDIVKQRYQQAIDWLKLVMKNPAMLTGENTGAVDGANSGVFVIANSIPNQWNL